MMDIGLALKERALWGLILPAPGLFLKKV